MLLKEIYGIDYSKTEHRNRHLHNSATVQMHRSNESTKT